MLKRILSILLTLIIVLSFAACNRGTDEDGTKTAETDASPNGSTGSDENATDDGSETGAPADDFVPVTADPYDYMANDLTGFIKLSEYKGLSVKNVSGVLTDEEFDTELDKIIEQYATYDQITDRAVEEGDTIVCDYAGYYNGEKFSGGTATDTELVVSENSGYIPGFAEAFVGKMPGVKFTFEVTFPDPYPSNTDLSGEVVLFSCTVDYIKGETPNIPELTDAFVSEKFGVATVEEYLTTLREELELQHEYTARSQMYSELWTNIVEASEVIAYPENEAERLYSEMRLTYQDYATYYGVDYATFLSSYLGLTNDDLIELANTYVKEDLVMYQLVKECNIELTEEKYDEYLASYAKLYGATGEELVSYYGKDQLQLTFLWEELMKTLLAGSVISE